MNHDLTKVDASGASSSLSDSASEVSRWSFARKGTNKLMRKKHKNSFQYADFVVGKCCERGEYLSSVLQSAGRGALQTA